LWQLSVVVAVQTSLADQCSAVEALVDAVEWSATTEQVRGPAGICLACKHLY
jgi:hypothetical protein